MLFELFDFAVHTIEPQCFLQFARGDHLHEAGENISDNRHAKDHHADREQLLGRAQLTRLIREPDRAHSNHDHVERVEPLPSKSHVGNHGPEDHQTENDRSITNAIPRASITQHVSFSR